MNKESESNHLMEAEEVNAVSNEKEREEKTEGGSSVSNEKEREQKGVRTSKVTPLPAVMLILILFN